MKNRFFLLFFIILFFPVIHANAGGGDGSSFDVDSASNGPLIVVDDYETNEKEQITAGVYAYYEGDTAKYMYLSCSSGLYIEKRGNGLILHSFPSASCSCHYVNAYSNGTTSSSDSDFGCSVSSGLPCTYRDGYNDYNAYSTNLPIFDSSDSDYSSKIESYRVDGDKSGAVNSSKYNKIDDYDSSIPIPHNFKVLKGVKQTIVGVENNFIQRFNREIVLSWEQDDITDNMQYVIEANVCYKYITGSEDFKNYTGTYQEVASSSYGSSKSMSVSLGTDTMNNLLHPEAGRILTKTYFRIRNKVGQKTSNWITICVDYVNETATASEESFDDSTIDVDSDEYNDSDVNKDSDSSNGGNGTNGRSVNINGIMSYIRDGFGLLGNGGIIALMSRTFLYLPNSIWTLLKFFVAMMISVAMIKLVKDVIL